MEKKFDTKFDRLEALISKSFVPVSVPVEGSSFLLPLLPPSLILGSMAAVDSLPVSSAPDLAGISVNSLLNSVDLARIYGSSTVGQAPADVQASAAHFSSPGPSTDCRGPASDQIARLLSST